MQGLPTGCFTASIGCSARDLGGGEGGVRADHEVVQREVRQRDEVHQVPSPQGVLLGIQMLAVSVR